MIKMHRVHTYIFQVFSILNFGSFFHTLTIPKGCGDSAFSIIVARPCCFSLWRSTWQRKPSALCPRTIKATRSGWWVTDPPWMIFSDVVWSAWWVCMCACACASRRHAVTCSVSEYSKKQTYRPSHTFQFLPFFPFPWLTNATTTWCILLNRIYDIFRPVLSAHWGQHVLHGEGRLWYDCWPSEQRPESGRKEREGRRDIYLTKGAFISCSCRHKRSE